MSTVVLHSIQFVLGTRDVHFVMSAALAFVNYTSHIDKTCRKRNLKSYPITMNKIALTPSAMWLFDAIKKYDVINCA